MWSLFYRKARSPKPARRNSSSRPRLEVLEDRCLLNAGTLDPTFGSGGIVTSSLKSGTNDGGDHVVVQPDGKIIEVGEVTTTSNHGSTTYQYGLERFNPNGTLDTTFGNNGIVLVSTSSGGPVSGYWDVALQPDGKIDVMSGRSWTIYQYNANGTLDTTFGNKGQAAIPLSGYAIGASDVPYDLVIEPPTGGNTEGKIVVVGTVNAPTGEVGIARLNPGGSLDTTFGNGGTLTLNLTPSTGYLAFFKSVAVQNDGKIVVSGAEGSTRPTASNPRTFVMARFNADGSLDTTFGSGGIVTTSAGAMPFQMDMAVLVQPSDGKIIAVGNGTDANGTGYGVLIRYNPDGSLDTTFGNGGIVTTAGLTLRDAAFGADGNIVVDGNEGSPFAVARYLDQATTINGVTYPAGSLDPTFGTGGIATTAGVAGEGIAVQPDGKIVAAGWSQVGSYNDFTLLRYLAS